MSDFYDRDGQPIDVLYWAKKYEDPDYKRVAEDQVGDAWVSTVWLGLDHNWAGKVPIIFETMIFGGDHDGEMWRYANETDARVGHGLVVDALRKGVMPNDSE